MFITELKGFISGLFFLIQVTFFFYYFLKRPKLGWNNYLGFFLLCEIIFDVECLPDLLWGFAFDHVGHRLAGDI